MVCCQYCHHCCCQCQHLYHYCCCLWAALLPTILNIEFKFCGKVNHGSPNIHIKFHLSMFNSSLVAVTSIVFLNIDNFSQNKHKIFKVYFQELRSQFYQMNHIYKPILVVQKNFAGSLESAN